MPDGGRSRQAPGRVGRMCAGNYPRNKTHRWLSVPEQSPIDFREPLVLLDLARPALAPQSCEFILVKQLDDDVLARPEV